LALAGLRSDGGLHAIREFGIPGVVGAAGALTAVPDGALVEVNAETGTVRVLPDS